MSRKLLPLLLIVVLATAGIASAQQATGTISNAYFLNLRTGPGVEYNSIAELSRGTAVTLVGRNAEATWVKIVISGYTEGWVNAKYVATTYNIALLPVTSVVSTANATVNTNFLNMRDGPGANFTIIGTFARGQSLTLIGRNADATWVQAINAVGGTGWFSARYLLVNAPVSLLPITSYTGITPGYTEPVPTGGQTGIVNTFALNVRYGPTVYYGVMDTITLGTGVSLVARSAVNTGWILIQMADGYSGWVNGRYITTSYPLANLPIK